MLEKLLVFIVLITFVHGHKCYWYTGPLTGINKETPTCVSGGKPCWVISSRNYVMAMCESYRSFCFDEEKREKLHDIFREKASKDHRSALITRSKCCRSRLCNGEEYVYGGLENTKSKQCFKYTGPRSGLEKYAEKCTTEKDECWAILSTDYIRADCGDSSDFCKNRNKRLEEEKKFETMAINDRQKFKVTHSGCCSGHLCNGEEEEIPTPNKKYTECYYYTGPLSEMEKNAEKCISANNQCWAILSEDYVVANCETSRLKFCEDEDEKQSEERDFEQMAKKFFKNDKSGEITRSGCCRGNMCNGNVNMIPFSDGKKHTKCYEYTVEKTTVKGNIETCSGEMCLTVKVGGQLDTTNHMCLNKDVCTDTGKWVMKTGMIEQLALQGIKTSFEDITIDCCNTDFCNRGSFTKCFDYTGPLSEMTRNTQTCLRESGQCWAIFSDDYVMARCESRSKFCGGDNEKQSKEKEFKRMAEKNGKSPVITRSGCCQEDFCNGYIEKIPILEKRYTKCSYYTGPRAEMKKKAKTCFSEKGECWIISSADFVLADCSGTLDVCKDKRIREFKEYAFQRAARSEDKSDVITRNECCSDDLCNAERLFSPVNAPNIEDPQSKEIHSSSHLNTRSSMRSGLSTTSSSMSSLPSLTLFCLSAIIYSMQ